jgi:hypothetical protein
MSVGRPLFGVAWLASQKIYDPNDPLGKVAKVVGGHVAMNINAPPPRNWPNTCAVRMSYILNYSGVHIPALGIKTASGSDKKNYFYRVPDVIDFLARQWGKPDLIVPYPPPGGGAL